MKRKIYCCLLYAIVLFQISLFAFNINANGNKISALESNIEKITYELTKFNESLRLVNKTLSFAIENFERKLNSDFLEIQLGYFLKDEIYSEKQLFLVNDQTTIDKINPIYGLKSPNHKSKLAASCPSPFIAHTSIAPTIDGSADACWSVAEVGTFTHVTYPLGGLIPSDFGGTQWRALYDNTYLYILVEVKDLIKVRNSVTWWQDDAVEIYVDADNNGGSSYDSKDFQYGFRYIDGTVHVGTYSATDITGIIFAQGNLPEGYNMEISIPWSTLGITPVAGNQIGFEVEVDDDDNGSGGNRDAQVSAFDNTGTAWNNPSKFGKVTLCDLKPDVTITQAVGQSDPTNSSTINFTATFSEPIKVFTPSAVTLSGTAGATNVVISGTGPVYNLAVSGMTGDGTVVVNIGAGVCTDLAGNSNTASVNTDNSVTYKATKPGVTITQAGGQSDPSNTSPINFTATFSEAVTGFTLSDVTLSGTAGATTVVVSGSGTTYNLAVSGMTGDGTVVVNIGAGVCTDLAGNSNTASVNTDNVVTYDATKPGVTITQAVGQTDPTNLSTINFTATFSEVVTGFTVSDVTLSGTSGATNVIVSGAGPVYNLAVSGMTGDGTVIVAINAGVCADLVGNTNNVSTNTDNSVTYDLSKPSVTITQAGGQADPTNSSPINFIATFSEPVTGFTLSDVTFSGTAGATTVGVSGSGTTYNIAVSGMTGDGTVIATINAGVCTDLAGNTNNASINTDNSVTYDLSKPNVTITLAGGQSDPSNSSPINFTATFSEPVTGFISSDVTLNGTAGATTVVVSGAGPAYNLAVSGMTVDGTVIVTINAGVCSDLAGNLNNASINTSNSVSFIADRPSVSINKGSSQPSIVNSLPISFDVAFNKNVVDFSFDDINWTGTASGITGTVSGSGQNYTVTITGITSAGTIIASIPANKVHNGMGIGNLSSVSIDNSVTYDITRPGVVITKDLLQQDTSNSAVISFSVSFSKPILNFTTSDVQISGSSGANTISITGGPQNYTIGVSGMSLTGSVIINIPQNVANDNAGNLNLASTNNDNTVYYDNIKPDATIATTAQAPTHLNQIPITIEFSKFVSGFNVSDFNISNGSITILTEQVPGLVWSAMIVPANNGIINIQIPASAAVDRAGNYNNASNHFQIEYLGPEPPPIFEANNIFTPNSSLNRSWIIKNAGQYVDYEIVIKNSSGQQVYKTINYKNDWNGTYKNNSLPTGTYYYFFSSPDKKTVYKGFINIIYE